MLDKDLITQSQLWNMSLLISGKSIETFFTPPVASDEALYRSIPLDPASASRLRAVEDAIYENPLLLNTFRHTTVIVDTDNFVLLPDGFDTPDCASRAMRLTSDTDETPGTTIIRAAGLDAPALMMGIDSALAGFLRRTFFNIELTHPLAPVAAYFTAPDNTRPSLTAVLRPGGRMDITATDSNILLMANTFSYEAVDDAAYFILAARAAIGQTPDIPLFIAATPEERQLLAAVLTRAVPGINIPAALPYPAELWRSGTALASAPLPLILTNL